MRVGSSRRSWASTSATLSSRPSKGSSGEDATRNPPSAVKRNAPLPPLPHPRAPRPEIHPTLPYPAPPPPRDSGSFYGFEKVSETNDHSHIYRHAAFQKDKPALLDEISRSKGRF